MQGEFSNANASILKPKHSMGRADLGLVDHGCRWLDATLAVQEHSRGCWRATGKVATGYRPPIGAGSRHVAPVRSSALSLYTGEHARAEFDRVALCGKGRCKGPLLSTRACSGRLGNDGPLEICRTHDGCDASCGRKRERDTIVQ